jgi:pimeloyl-ACP methyl ester carboxylesterase
MRPLDLLLLGRRALVAGAALLAACSPSSGAAVSGGLSAAPGDAGVDPGSPGAPASGADGGAAAPAGPTPSSGGAGGLTCARRESVGAGRTSCVATIGGVELKVVEGAASPAGAPFRLGLYLHGDGAAAYTSGSALKAMLAWADAQHGLAVAALAPNGCAWWQAPTHACASTQADPDVTNANAAALLAALEGLLKAYDVRTDGARYYGSSGGSIFLTQEWLPLHGGAHPGVFALMCGGEVSTRAWSWDVTDAAQRAKSPLFFTYGDQDFLVPDITKAIADLTGKGFAITPKVVPSATHCAFDAHGEAVAIWSAHP